MSFRQSVSRLSFALLMPLVFGIAFQTPLGMVFLERVGVFSVEGYRRNRRLAIFLLALLAAVISVTPDYYSMLALTIPLWGLYELGILLCCVQRSQLAGDGEDLEQTGKLRGGLIRCGQRAGFSTCSRVTITLMAMRSTSF